MSLIVQKFGGTSVADPDCIRRVARRVTETQRAGNRVVVVVSAMAGATDSLLALAGELGGEAPNRAELDVLLATGEQQTIALLCMAIQSLGGDAQSFTGAQMGMHTDSEHGRARILHVDAERIHQVLSRGGIAVLAGFQGVDAGGRITTLGRGGSDTTAVAVACALEADICEIYTDVDGVFTADPNLVPGARKLSCIAYSEMLELASLGAKVLQIRSVKFAMAHGMPLHVRSSFHEGEGTRVVREEDVMEKLIVTGVNSNRDEAKIYVSGVKDTPGVAARLFSPLAEAGIVVDMIVQNLSQDGNTDLTFTVPKAEFKRALALARETAPSLGSAGVSGDENIAKVSVVGLGMKDHAGIAARMFSVLAESGINIQMISTSEIKISAVVEAGCAERAVRELHAAFLEDEAADRLAGAS